MKTLADAIEEAYFQSGMLMVEPKVRAANAALDWMEKEICDSLPNGAWRDELLQRIEEERG